MTTRSGELPIFDASSYGAEFEALQKRLFEQQEAIALDNRLHNKETWSAKVADFLEKKAQQASVPFSYEPTGDTDTYHFGADTVTIQKRLFDATVGTEGGTIRACIRQSDVAQFPWLREALEAFPINYVPV